jgi:hypothetical protein
VTDSGWFAARPSGTENIYKLYAESFKGKHPMCETAAGAPPMIGRRSAWRRWRALVDPLSGPRFRKYPFSTLRRSTPTSAALRPFR